MNRKFFILPILLFCAVNIYAQTDSVQTLSLKQAQDYAIENSPVIKNSKIDIESAKKKVWETTAIGLPQATGSLAYNYSITEPRIAELFSGMFSTPPDTAGNSTQGPTLDFKSSYPLDITVKQLVFSGAYIVGLQTSKTFKSLSEIALTKSINDLKESVSNSYFLVLVSRESLKKMNSLLSNTEKLYFETQATLNEGFIEETDADQVKIVLSSLKNQVNNLNRQVEISEKLLKFTLGLDYNVDIELTDSFDNLITDSLTIKYAVSEFILDNYSEYQMLKSQEKLMDLNLKYQKTNFLPNVAAFYVYHKQLNDNYLDFQSENMVGIQLSMPLFTSGQNIVKVQQAKMSLDQTRNSLKQAGNGLILEFEKTKSDYFTALDNFITQKENTETALKIYDKSLIKFKEGIIGGTELTQIQNQYFLAQTNYFLAINSLVTAKAKIEKMTDKN